MTLPVDSLFQFSCHRLLPKSDSVMIRERSTARSVDACQALLRFRWTPWPSSIRPISRNEAPSWSRRTGRGSDGAGRREPLAGNALST